MSLQKAFRDRSADSGEKASSSTMAWGSAGSVSTACDGPLTAIPGFFPISAPASFWNASVALCQQMPND
jgi:hypothetical protein